MSFIAIANLGFVVSLCDARTPHNAIETVRHEAFPNTRPTDPSERGGLLGVPAPIESVSHFTMASLTLTHIALRDLSTHRVPVHSGMAFFYYFPFVPLSSTELPVFGWIPCYALSKRDSKSTDRACAPAQDE